MMRILCGVEQSMYYGDQLSVNKADGTLSKVRSACVTSVLSYCTKNYISKYATI